MIISRRAALGLLALAPVAARAQEGLAAGFGDLGRKRRDPVGAARRE